MPHNSVCIACMREVRKQGEMDCQTQVMENLLLNTSIFKEIDFSCTYCHRTLESYYYNATPPKIIYSSRGRCEKQLLRGALACPGMARQITAPHLYLGQTITTLTCAGPLLLCVKPWMPLWLFSPHFEVSFCFISHLLCYLMYVRKLN